MFKCLPATEKYLKTTVKILAFCLVDIRCIDKSALFLRRCLPQISTMRLNLLKLCSLQEVVGLCLRLRHDVLCYFHTFSLVLFCLVFPPS